jgi:hypothetical protein
VVPDKLSTSRLSFLRFNHRGRPRIGAVVMTTGLSFDDVDIAYNAAKELDFQIRTLIWLAASSDPRKHELFNIQLDNVTCEYDDAFAAIDPILPILRSSQLAQFGFDVHPSMHVAILNAADNIRRKPANPDSYDDSTDAFFGFVGSIALPTQKLTDAHLWMERQATVAVLLPAGRPVDVPRFKRRVPKGVSLRDVALLLNEGDQDSATKTKKRWQALRKPKLPKSLGACSADGQSGLYVPSAILEFVKIVENLPAERISRMNRALKAKRRPIGNQ